MKLTLRLIEIESETIEPGAGLALLNLPTPPAASPRIEPRAIAAAAPIEPKRTHPGRRPMNGTRPKPEPAAPPTKAASGETQNAILQLLAKAPLTSGDLIAKSKLSPASVYSALTVLRQAGTIETKPDQDGLRKNWLK